MIGEIGVAFVVGREPGAVDDTELRNWCRDRIASYKIPDRVAFLPDLPVNATYKADVVRLRGLAAQLVADGQRS